MQLFAPGPGRAVMVPGWLLVGQGSGNKDVSFRGKGIPFQLVGLTLDT